ncbi:MAG: T9SS type A sorting domain-containing protein [Bacteroidales bacterium]|nr:T9SS type A sorting domain-containing protein [Bacteroidales bacterium]MCF8404957.1 T9SS type A sorting domain-containing protein [Bacteroidales bacterium]
MKKVILLVVSIFWLCGAINAFPWGHRYTIEQSNQHISVAVNTNFRVSVEWGEGDWDGAMGSAFGYGLSTDGTDWTWVELPYFEDGDGNNKRCRADVSISIPGKYYYSYRMIKAANGGTSYSYGIADWAENSASINAVSTIIVGEVSAQPGNWSANDTWMDGTVPVSSDDVAIMHDVIVSATGAVVNDLYIYSGKSLSIGPNSNLSVYGTLTNNGTLTLESDNTGSGSIIESSGVQANVERYISSTTGPGGLPGWHYISSPISALTSDVFSGIYLMEWDEPTEVWSFIEELGVNLNPSLYGYGVWANTGSTVTFSGQLNTGPQSINLTNTAGTLGPPENDPSGFNLVGNPYASSLDWDVPDGSGWTRSSSNVALSIYYWTGVQYASYVFGGPGTNGGTNVIPPHQGFFVKCTSTSGGSLSVNNGARIHSSTSFYKSIKEIEDQITFRAFGNGYSDEFIVNLNDEASSAFDPQFDAYKLMGDDQAPQVYSFSSDVVKLSINSFAQITDFKIMPVGFKVGVEGMYEISLTSINGFNGIPVYLEDLKENKVINIKANSNYKFYASPQDNSERFLLHFSNNESHFISEGGGSDNIIVYTRDKNIIIQNDEMGIHKVNVYNILGQEIYSGKLTNTYLEVEVAEKGNYIVKIFNNKRITSKKVFVR